VRNIAINAYAFKSGNPARTFLEYSKYFNQDALKLVPPYNPAEAQKLLAEIDRIANDTKYGTTSLISGSVNLTFQIGSSNIATQDMINVSTSGNLLTSSLTVALSISAIQKGDRKLSIMSLSATIVLGVAFLMLSIVTTSGLFFVGRLLPFR
jgi:hypothetical protein